jgi:hypothetical protein
MADAKGIVYDFMQALEAREFTRAADYLADSMIVTGFTPAPLTKKLFINVMSGLAEGFPNLLYNFHTTEESAETTEGTLVRGTVQITGSQVNSFELPALGIGPIPQMGGSISLPQQFWEFRVKNSLIASIQVERKPDGGIEGLLNQLGIHDPIVQ